MIGAGQRQDVEARRAEFEALMRKHQDQIFHYCVLRLGPVSGEDVAQDVFVAAWQGLEQGSFRGEATPATWLMGIAKKKCMQVFRNASRRQELAHRCVEEIRQNLHQHEEAVSGQKQRQAQLQRLEQALRGLTSEERILVNLRYLKGVAAEEIAELMGKSAAAVRKQLLRTLQRLRRTLSHGDEED